jgi:hypothetical protein
MMQLLTPRRTAMPGGWVGLLALTLTGILCTTLAAQPPASMASRLAVRRKLRDYFFPRYQGTASPGTLLDADNSDLRALRISAAPTDPSKLASAFVLASEGSEYEANLAVLEEPAIIWQRSPQTYVNIYRAGRKTTPAVGTLLSSTGNLEDEPEPLEVLPTLLAQLYLQRGDKALIRRLFEWRFDGAPQEVLNSQRLQLLVERPDQVLQVVYPSKTLTDAMVDALVYADPPEYERAVARINEVVPSLDAEIARVARDVINRARSMR